MKDPPRLFIKFRSPENPMVKKVYILEELLTCNFFKQVDATVGSLVGIEQWAFDAFTPTINTNKVNMYGKVPKSVDCRVVSVKSFQ